jgi:hypothetical protein
LHSLYSQAPRKLDSGKLDSEELALSALQEALALSRDLFCSQLPGRQQFSRELHWNLWDVYQGVLRGEPLSLEPGLWLFKGQRESAQMLHFKSVCLQAPHVHQLRESQGQLQL